MWAAEIMDAMLALLPMALGVGRATHVSWRVIDALLDGKKPRSEEDNAVTPMPAVVRFTLQYPGSLT